MPTKKLGKEFDLELSICSAHLFVEPTAHDTSLLEVVPDPCRFVNATRHYLGVFPRQT